MTAPLTPEQEEQVRSIALGAAAAVLEAVQFTRHHGADDPQLRDALTAFVRTGRMTPLAGGRRDGR